MQTPLAKNAESLAREMSWFATVVNTRLDQHFAKENAHAQSSAMDIADEAGIENFQSQAPPDLEKDNSIYAEFVKYYMLTASERILLMLALAPHIQPHLLMCSFRSIPTQEEDILNLAV